MSSRARHPSTSAAVTGDRVRKYLAIFWRLKCFLMYSCPSSSSHHAQGAGFQGLPFHPGLRLWKTLGDGPQRPRAAKPSRGHAPQPGH
jgi:hypothetical protein